MSEMTPLRLALRRDRGYVYFPDAIMSCLKLFAGGDGCTDVKAECYKTSAHEIVVEQRFGECPDLRRASVFAWISWREGQRARDFVLHETSVPNPSRYDLVEPPFDHRFQGSRIDAVIPAGSFPSHFHRWAVLCKKLYHHAEPDGRRRMLIQRMVAHDSSIPFQDGTVNETARLDFVTKDHSMKFSIWQGERRSGEVVAAARVFG